MNSLLIQQDKEPLKVIPALALLGLSTITVDSYFESALSDATLVMIGATIIFTAFAWRNLYTFSKRQVLINKSAMLIEVTDFSFWGAKKQKGYPLDNFNRVQSYINYGRGARNIVELVTSDGNRGLLLSSFLSCGGTRFWSLTTETENPKASALASKVANFMEITNTGYIGHKWTTTQVEIDDNGKFISNNFRI